MEILIGILVGKATDFFYLIIIKKYLGISKLINVSSFLCKSGFEKILGKISLLVTKFKILGLGSPALNTVPSLEGDLRGLHAPELWGPEKKRDREKRHMHKIFGQKEMNFFLNNCMYSNSKCTDAYFCLIFFVWGPSICPS